MCVNAIQIILQRLNLTWLVFEAFPLVYPVYYGMNLGQVGLVFLCILVSCLTGVSIYSAYILFYLNPRIIKLGLGTQESRLIPALVASLALHSGSLFLPGLPGQPSTGQCLPSASPYQVSLIIGSSRK